MSCNFSDRFFVMNCGLCISGLLCQRKHSYSYSYSYSCYIVRKTLLKVLSYCVFDLHYRANVSNAKYFRSALVC